MHKKSFTIALAGNPNSGKTTIFNNITGTRQKVGNWPGVTVEKKEGAVSKYGYDLKIIDLPGTYSLTPFSIEEIVARDFVLDESPDVVIDIIDASNLERSLYLATQLRELDCKVLFALNMADVAFSRGTKIDAEKMSELLNVPVVFTTGNKNKGIDSLLKTAIELAESKSKISQKRKVKYSKDIEDSISKLQSFIEERLEQNFPYNIRWTAIKLLENDKIVRERIRQKTGNKSLEILREVETHRKHLLDRFDDDPEIVMTDERYGFIAGIIKEVVTTSKKRRIDTSRNVDLLLTNRFVGLPIFILFIWIMFQTTFAVGSYPMEWLDNGVNWLSTILETSLPDSLFKDLLLNGIIAGVGSVIIFLPNILILFLFIAIFEDTGYMSRAAFLMDKIMHLIGLHGKSFIPMLMGFGCNVPAIMATRILESNKDRILTILITPFMSCSAKLPIYILLAGTFFSARAGTVIFSIYIIGIILSIITGRLFRSTLFKGADAPFVMELPPYRVPMIKSLIIHMWDRSKMFLKKMGGIILVGSVIVWMLTAFPRNINYSMDYNEEINKIDASFTEKQKKAAITKLIRAKQAEKAEKSFMGRIGKTIAPVFAPIGIDWRGSVALLTGFVAKEIVVSTFGILYATEETDEPDALKNALLSSEMTSLSALSLMVFVLLYLPCVATIATIRRETGSLKWTLFSVGYSTSIAWAAAFCVYQGGKILGFT
ncbi:MAG: ferrous iron transport protein B [Proteobacteria bacterium]|nr:ferrous iron transport protein B [Desulfobacteraceae bacterium]MBU3981849.1 ferrous iron transport protein B [Pseudomonadota bacterium]MBU4012508.1 ferrous iron transport protein B [Pseudomonadota bacterium]MBU4067564.1 ferrous iron transport protein B [Pseudomonadota bacterium]MBU4126843.1 ferrous iron transport protein B [Pseudomonadota bacterium]